MVVFAECVEERYSLTKAKSIPLLRDNLDTAQDKNVSFIFINSKL